MNLLLIICFNFEHIKTLVCKLNILTVKTSYLFKKLNEMSTIQTCFNKKNILQSCVFRCTRYMFKPWDCCKVTVNRKLMNRNFKSNLRRKHIQNY